MKNYSSKYYNKGKKCKQCGIPIGNKTKTGLCRGCRNKFYPLSHTDKWKEKISKERLGDKNPMWKGENVQLGALHEWVNKRKEKPELCELCGKRPAYDLANKGVYNRELENWWYLCRSCHMRTDGRIKNLTSYRE